VRGVSLTPAPLLDVIAESLAEWTEPFVELSIFGTRDAEAIAGAVEQFCAIHLGADPTSALFWRASTGVAAGLLLDDDRVVVLKAHQPAVDRDHIASVLALREALFEAGYPTPRVLGGPHTLGHGSATVEAFVDPGPTADGFAVRDLLARGLHGFCRMATQLAQGRLFAPPAVAMPAGKALWPAPHSRLFDFERTADGAETIDEIAEVAKDRVVPDDDTPKLVAHLDWRVEHVRVRGGAIRSVYDWDAVHRVPEAHAVGNAAAHFAANWETGFSARRYPTPEESDAFVAAYVSARGEPFDEHMRRQIGAFRTYGLAYAARCGHDPKAAPIPGAAEEMLLRFGERYLVVRG
jgi:hypothetical protein